MPTSLEPLWLVAILALTLTALVFDLRLRKIPNWLTVSALGLGLTFQSVVGGWSGFTAALQGFGIGFGVLFVLWLMGAGGGGDVKLMGALGAWLAAQLTVYTMISSAVFVVLGGGAVFMAALILRRPMAAGSASVSTPESRAARRLMPFAVPLALGTWCILAWKVASEYQHG